MWNKTEGKRGEGNQDKAGKARVSRREEEEEEEEKEEEKEKKRLLDKTLSVGCASDMVRCRNYQRASARQHKHEPCKISIRLLIYFVYRRTESPK